MISLMRIGNAYFSPDRKEFLIDSADDVQNLPNSKKDGAGINGKCAPGSVAYTPDLKIIYMLGNDDAWHDASEEVN